MNTSAPIDSEFAAQPTPPHWHNPAAAAWPPRQGLCSLGRSVGGGCMARGCWGHTHTQVPGDSHCLQRCCPPPQRGRDTPSRFGTSFSPNLGLKHISGLGLQSRGKTGTERAPKPQPGWDPAERAGPFPPSSAMEADRRSRKKGWKPPRASPRLRDPARSGQAPAAGKGGNRRRGSLSPGYGGERGQSHTARGQRHLQLQFART